MRIGEERFLGILAGAANAVGTAEFDNCLLQLTRSLVGHDTCLAMRLSTAAAPRTIEVDGLSDEVMRAYENDFYRDDPIHSNWVTGALPQIHGLQKIDRDHVRATPYYRDFLSSLANISDELGIILPRLGSTALGMWIQRARGGFKERDFARIRQVFPLIANLNRCHQSHLVASLRDLAEKDLGQPPIAIKAVDAHGNMIYCDASWHGCKAGAKSIDEMTGAMRRNNRSSIMLDDGHLLRRIPLSDDALVGPGGTLFVVQNSSRDAGKTVPDRGSCWELLTQREAEIVRLVLAGYPNALISEKLALSLGTVKNYRSRLYYKLDVTTERELILMFSGAE